MLAPSNQPRDDLWYTTLLALMRVGHQALHVRLQQRNKSVVEITEQSLEEWGKKIYFFLLEAFSASAHQLQQISPWTNRTCVGWTCLFPCGPPEKETRWTDWWIPGLRSGQRWFSPAVEMQMEKRFLVWCCTASLNWCCTSSSVWSRTSVISSLVKLCLGWSSRGA